MKIGRPQVHLRKDSSSGTYYIHVVTWFDYTKFISDGIGSVATTATSGVFPIVLKVKEDASVPNMKLLTPVVHTLALTGLALSGTSPFIQVTIVNTSASNAEVDKRKTHQDDADESSMPDPGSKK